MSGLTKASKVLWFVLACVLSDKASRLTAIEGISSLSLGTVFPSPIVPLGPAARSGLENLALDFGSAMLGVDGVIRKFGSTLATGSTSLTASALENLAVTNKFGSTLVFVLWYQWAALGWLLIERLQVGATSGGAMGARAILPLSLGTVKATVVLCSLLWFVCWSFEFSCVGAPCQWHLPHLRENMPRCTSCGGTAGQRHLPHFKGEHGRRRGEMHKLLSYAPFNRLIARAKKTAENTPR